MDGKVTGFGMVTARQEGVTGAFYEKSSVGKKYLKEMCRRHWREDCRLRV